jgi:exosortase family protein XrtF
LDLRRYLNRYKPFLLFLAKFFFTYLILTIAYQFYLSRFDEARYEVDDLTHAVATQSITSLKLFGSDAHAEPHLSQPCIRLVYNGEYVARIIEGCNAISVMILFAAFVVAFSGKWKNTALFILGGCVLIHILNVARIALLCSAIYHFPAQEHFLHGVIFPLFIYSVVFMLWVIWVNKFSDYARRTSEK